MTGWDESPSSETGGGIDPVRRVSVDVLTSDFRVTGQVETRFGRVTEILNQLTGAHLTVEGATIAEHGARSGLTAPRAFVAVEEILVMIAPDLPGTSREVRVPKRPVRAHLALPAMRVEGTVHVPIGSRPVDGVVHGTERFLAVTDATLRSTRNPSLDRTAPVLALRRDRAHVLLVAADERPDELLADVLDEATAEAWLRDDAEREGA